MPVGADMIDKMHSLLAVLIHTLPQEWMSFLWPQTTIQCHHRVSSALCLGCCLCQPSHPITSHLVCPFHMIYPQCCLQLEPDKASSRNSPCPVSCSVFMWYRRAAARERSFGEKRFWKCRGKMSPCSSPSPGWSPWMPKGSLSPRKGLMTVTLLVPLVLWIKHCQRVNEAWQLSNVQL